MALPSFGTGIAHAVTLRTLFVHVDIDQSIRVLVTNLGKKPINDLTVTLTDDDGDVLVPFNDLCAEGGPLPPGNTCQVIYSPNAKGLASVTAKGKFSASVQVTTAGSPALVTVVPATK
jgi:hypothetical protein